MKKFLLITLFLFLVPASVQAQDQTRQDKEEIYKGLSNFTRVLDLIERNYVEDVDPEVLTESAIEGMLKTLDPYSAYLSPERYRELEIGTSGEFGGVGMEIATQNGVLTVIAPIEGSPAEKAGVEPGDQILQINGESTKGLTVFEAVKTLRGPKGTSVNITIKRDGEEKLREIKLVRDRILVKSVKSDLISGGIGYIKLTQFQDNTTADLKDALTNLETRNGTKLKGIVLDLRNNPGGLLNQAIDVVDEFVDKGVIVSVKGRSEDESRQFYASQSGSFRDYPLIVIVNKGSASASEVVAEALQDSGRALIIGTKTFGKGSVQTIIELEDGSGLKLTTARFYAPSGRSINEVGVTPDIVVEKGMGNEDNQLKRAVELIRTSKSGEIVPKKG